MKHNLLICFLASLFSFGLSIGAFACDFSPSVNATNLIDNGDGTFSVDIFMCIGERGSENGPLIYFSDGINILSTSAPQLLSPTTGNIAEGSITGGVLSYSFDGSPEFWEPDDEEFGPCFSFTLTVDGDPTSATISFENINDNCFNDVSGGVWTTTILSNGSCTADLFVTAPAAIDGNTNGAGNDCDFRPSADQTIEVEILCDGVYTFSTCDAASWDTYIFLSTNCCAGEIIENDDLCGAQSSITAYLPEGIYYLTVEGFDTLSDGAFTVDITQGEPPYRAETGPDQDICEDHTIITANDPIFGSGMWSVLTGSGEILNPDSSTTEVINLSNGINQFIWTLGEAPCGISTDTITVIAAGNLMISCASDETVNAAPGECSAVVNYAPPVASSECSSVTVTQIAGLGSGSTFPVGTTLEQYLVTDTLGNSDSCFVAITVVDAEDPVITCPDDIEADNEPGECFAVVNFTEPVGTDNCPGASTILLSGIPSGDEFPVGTTTNIYQVTDAAGNLNVCTVDITVNDSEDPVFDSCPGDLVVDIDDGSCDAVVNYDLPVASDNCPGLSAVNLISGLPPGATFQVGTTTVVYEVSDAAGNTASCTFTVTVEENVLPEITCPDDIVVSVSDGECGAIVNYAAPFGTDNCPGSTTSLTAGLGPNSFFPVGTTIETYEVTDASGNTATCSFTVTVNDTIQPVINCPADIVADNDPGECGAVVNFAAPAGSDNCPGETVTLVSPLGPGDFFPAGTTMVSYMVEDAAGNISTCSFNVTVHDIESPEPECSDLVVDNDPGECFAVVNYDLPTATDNCGEDDITVVLVSGLGSGGTFSIGSHEEIYSFTDGAGNMEVCTINITVQDAESPEIICPEDEVVILDEADCTTTINYVVPAGTDNCPGVTTTHVSGPLPGTEVPAGEHTIVFQAEDAAGNTTTCEFTITVVETVDPTISCPENMVVYSASGACGAEVNYTAPTGDDNCPGAITSLTDGLGSGAFFPLGDNIETYTVTDLNGNTASCSFTITVLDTISPTITCPDDIVVNADEEGCTAVVNYEMPTATDDCGGEVTVELVSGLPSGSEFPVGNNTIVISAEDASGNITTCSFVISVTGDSEPSITCPDDIVISSIPDSCGTIVEYPTPEAEDACGGDITLTLEEGLESGSFFPVGTTTIEYSATNSLGISVSCSFNITVEDDVAPEFDCPEDIEIVVEDEVCEFDVLFDDPTASDNCGLATIELTQGDPSGTTLGIGTHTIGYVATDINGNTAFCSFNIIITDAVDPTISGCPDDITVETADGECGAIVNYDEPTGADNCGFTIAPNDGFESGAFFPVGETTVTWTVTDLSGNTASCSFTVTVIDDIDPTVTCENITTCDPFVDWEVDASDNCEIESIEITEGYPSGDEFPVGTTTVTVLVTDASGNTAECSFEVTVEVNTNSAEAGPDQVLCDTDETQLEANTPENGSGIWEFVTGSGSLSDVTDPNATLSNLETGVIILSWNVSGSGSCPATSDEVTITVDAGVTVDAGEDESIVSGGSVNLEATASGTGGSFSWSPETGLSCTNCADPVASPTTTTTYTVTYTTPNGCEYSDQVTVDVPVSEVPSGFTPDGDNVNDFWNIPNVTDDIEVKIYNRWGNLIFESTGYNEPWDGTYNNKPLPTGSYYYVIDYKDGNDPVNGTITLIR